VVIKIQKISGTEDLPTPSYAHPGDAGLDLYSREETTLAPGERKMIPTGLRLEVPDGYVGLVWDKSGVSIEEGLKTLGGVLDSGYRGELMVGMINLSTTTYTFLRGHKVAQLLIQKIENPKIEIVAGLGQTTRGEGGFGSTGK
jgi:dUTP pyrophosphatase